MRDGWVDHIPEWVSGEGFGEGGKRRQSPGESQGQFFCSPSAGNSQLNNATLPQCSIPRALITCFSKFIFLNQFTSYLKAPFILLTIPNYFIYFKNISMMISLLLMLFVINMLSVSRFRKRLVPYARLMPLSCS